MTGGPELSGSAVWFGTSNGAVGSMSLKDGKSMTWRGGSPVSAGPVAFGEGVLVGFRSGLLRAFGRDGVPYFVVDLETEVTALVRWRKQIIASTAKGHLIAFDASAFSKRP